MLSRLSFFFLLGISLFGLSYSYRVMDIHGDFPTCPSNDKDLEEMKPIEKRKTLYNVKEVNSNFDHKTQQNENMPSNWLMQIIKIITIPMETHLENGRNQENRINGLPKRRGHISELQPKREQNQAERSPKIVLLIKAKPHEKELRIRKRNPLLYHLM
ncbi:uncharacterized protein DMAD_08525 [Drosophila madeirensis]|uniref:Seminal fluid protein n=1 Tax=Drosophila madeirensis TaxID=30013 RepID=A0AAU9ESI2_DROMD